MKKWKVKAKQGSRVVTVTVATETKESAETYTKYALGESSTQPVQILETIEKTKKKK